MQSASLIDPNDRPAAGADRVHRERREPHRKTADRSLVLAASLSFDDGADVGGRAAHVERERVLEARSCSRVGRADDAGSRSREQRERRVTRRFLQGREPTRRAHDERLDQVSLTTRGSERVQIPAEDRPEVRVDDRRRSAFVLAELGRDLVRCDHMCLRIPAAKLCRDRALVLRVTEREQGADGDCIRIDVAERVEVERLQDAFGPNPLAHAETPLERDEGRRVLGAGPIEVRARLPPEVEKVLEPGSGHERGPRTSPFEQCVGGDRRPVGEAVDDVGADQLRRREHGLLLVSRRGHLDRPDRPVAHENGIRERPTDVDAQEGGRCAHGRILDEGPQ